VGGAEPTLRPPFSARSGAISAVSRDVRAGGGVIGAMTMEFDERFSPDELLAHSKWMRKLAVRLVGDSAGADDLVQQTVAAWIAEGEVDQGFLRPWLATVMKNLARTNWRSEVRRRRREMSTARSEVLEVDDTAATLEMHELLVGAIKGIAEAQQVVIVQHFFHEKSLAEIARELDLPESTVRNRLQRALEALKGKLDKNGGGRESWVAMFIAFANRAKPSAALPAGMAASSATMGVLAWMAVAATIALLGVGAGYWWQRERQHGLERESALLASAPQVRPPVARDPTVAPAPDVSSRAPIGAAPPAPVASATARPIEPAIIELVAVDAQGAAIADATLTLLYEVGTEDVAAPDAPRAHASSDGRLRLAIGRSEMSRINHPGDLRVALAGDKSSDPTMSGVAFVQLSAPRCATRAEFVPVTMGQTAALGSIVLGPGGSASGTVVTSDGSALPPCSVHVLPVTAVTHKNGVPVAEAPVRSDGSYALNDVPIGDYQVAVAGEMAGWHQSALPTVQIRAGETSAVPEVVLARLSNAITGIVLTPELKPALSRTVAYVASSLADATFDRWPTVTTDDAGRFEIRWQRQETCDLFILGDGISTGDLVMPSVAAGTLELELRLPEPAWTSFTVVDENNAPIRKFSTSCTWAQGSEHHFGSRNLEHPDGIAIVPLHVRPFFATFSADGRFEDTIGPISPTGEAQQHSAVLRPMATIAGTVTGAEAKGVTVDLRAVVGDGSDFACDGFPCRLAPDSVHHRVRPDAGGSFKLTARERGRYVVLVHAHDLADYESAPFEYDPHRQGIELAVVLARGGTIEGQVIVETTKSAAISSPEGLIVGVSRGDGSFRFARVGADGRYAFEHLAAGRWWIRRCERDFNAAGELTYAQVTGFDPSLTPFVVEDGKVAHFDLDLRGATCTVDGKLESPLVENGKLTATLVALPDQPGIKHTPVPIASDGTFHIEAKVLGMHQLAIDGHLGDGRELHIEDTLELKRGSNAWTRVLPK
jgi:RNA polymerase sigma-70 factor (ECF subfamily)